MFGLLCCISHHDTKNWGLYLEWLELEARNRHFSDFLDFSKSAWISLTLYYKISYHKWKSLLNWNDYGPNINFRSRLQKGSEITLKVLRPLSFWSPIESSIKFEDCVNTCPSYSLSYQAGSLKHFICLHITWKQ